MVLRISVGGFLLSGSKSDLFNTSFDFFLLVSVVGSGILSVNGGGLCLFSENC